MTWDELADSNVESDLILASMAVSNSQQAVFNAATVNSESYAVTGRRRLRLRILYLAEARQSFKTAQALLSSPAMLRAQAREAGP